jgi:hypothetical protein
LVLIAPEYPNYGNLNLPSRSLQPPSSVFASKVCRDLFWTKQCGALSNQKLDLVIKNGALKYQKHGLLDGLSINGECVWTKFELLMGPQFLDPIPNQAFVWWLFNTRGKGLLEISPTQHVALCHKTHIPKREFRHY